MAAQFSFNNMICKKYQLIREWSKLFIQKHESLEANEVCNTAQLFQLRKNKSSSDLIEQQQSSITAEHSVSKNDNLYLQAVEAAPPNLGEVNTPKTDFGQLGLKAGFCVLVVLGYLTAYIFKHKH